MKTEDVQQMSKNLLLLIVKLLSKNKHEMRNYRRFKTTAATAKLKVKREKKRKKGMQEMFTAVENQ